MNRRWFQFSLRTWFIVVTLVTFSAWFVGPPKRIRGMADGWLFEPKTELIRWPGIYRWRNREIVVQVWRTKDIRLARHPYCLVFDYDTGVAFQIASGRQYPLLKWGTP